ncbi:ABC transporter ATP-binding protein [Streptomyces agglomeratus]|uniref:ABC transporter ATP-binding protein n=1 Tax=Streptomyces agglomeratus TaxID=285458 RepID=A0A1E5P9C2_9ACTN|nr:ATP-binding cassette domain-containing protein [Streptomyces agglomeratus]OEJ26163.1 ABC transporter ATP-binding protein [Streptomyces agglomeratus]OEJ52344.1 ABC transporter ATP-binding protein [Streptomyces agglomeratus]
MSAGPVVAFRNLTKSFGGVTAVEDLTFEVRPGRVTGLLGRNGAGKTTTLRMLLGLAAPTSGSATVFGSPYAQLPRAAHRVGVCMDGLGSVPGATGRRELDIWSATLGLPARRTDEVLGLVGLSEAADRPVKGYSTGMRQRLGLATALLPDPELLILDEPANGLDPDGIRQLRETLRALAAEGRTVLVSSHLLAEVEQTVDDVVVVQRTLRYAGTLADLTGNGAHRLEDRFFALAGEAPGTDAASGATGPRPEANPEAKPGSKPEGSLTHA